VKTWQLARR